MNKIKKIINQNQGISIIEVLVAMMVVVMSLLSITLLSTKSIKLSQLAQDRDKAITLAQETIEQVRYNRDTMSWSQFVGSNTDNIQSLSDDKFDVTVTVRDKDHPKENLELSDNVALVTVKVSWVDGDPSDPHNTHFIEHETYLGKKL